jgi:hypothetical protein
MVLALRLEVLNHLLQLLVLAARLLQLGLELADVFVLPLAEVLLRLPILLPPSLRRGKKCQKLLSGL